MQYIKKIELSRWAFLEVMTLLPKNKICVKVLVAKL